MKSKTHSEMLSRILPDSKFKFLGYKGIHKMRNGNIAEVTLKSSSTHKKYNGLRVHIVNKNDGSITCNDFKFDDYLGQTADRFHPNARLVKEMHIWENDGIAWYILKPKSVKPINTAIMDFIEIYDDYED
jgi:hypothetical protein